MMNVSKPRTTSDALCPLMRRRMCKVCHACNFWEVLPVRIVKDGAVVDTEHWACTITHQTYLIRKVLHAVEGSQAAQESFRNTAWNESQKNLHDMVEMAKHQGAFNAEMLKKICESLTGFAHSIALAAPRAGEDTKLLNGKSEQ